MNGNIYTSHIKRICLNDLIYIVRVNSYNHMSGVHYIYLALQYTEDIDTVLMATHG
jgi:hypothetical protein